MMHSFVHSIPCGPCLCVQAIQRSERLIDAPRDYGRSKPPTSRIKCLIIAPLIFIAI